MNTEIILAFVGLILTIIIFVVERKNTLLDRFKDKKDKKANLALSVGTALLKPNLINRIIFIINESDESKKTIYYEFPLNVSNQGKSTIENIHLSIEYASKSFLPIEDLWIKFNNPLEDGVFSRKYQKTNKNIYTTTSIKYINPEMIYKISELLKLSKTVFNISTTAKTKDNKEVYVEAITSMYHSLRIQLDAKDAGVLNYDLQVELISIKNAYNLNDKLKKVEKYLNTPFKSLNNTQKLEYLLKHKSFFLFPQLIKFENDKKEKENLYYGIVDEKDILIHEFDLFKNTGSRQ